jgi:hypothetical protein
MFTEEKAKGFCRTFLLDEKQRLVMMLASAAHSSFVYVSVLIE